MSKKAPAAPGEGRPSGELSPGSDEEILAKGDPSNAPAATKDAGGPADTQSRDGEVPQKPGGRDRRLDDRAQSSGEESPGRLSANGQDVGDGQDGLSRAESIELEQANRRLKKKRERYRKQRSREDAKPTQSESVLTQRVVTGKPSESQSEDTGTTPRTLWVQKGFTPGSHTGGRTYPRATYHTELTPEEEESELAKARLETDPAKVNSYILGAAAFNARRFDEATDAVARDYEGVISPTWTFVSVLKAHPALCDYGADEALATVDRELDAAGMVMGGSHS